MGLRSPASYTPALHLCGVSNLITVGTMDTAGAVKRTVVSSHGRTCVSWMVFFVQILDLSQH